MHFLSIKWDFWSQPTLCSTPKLSPHPKKPLETWGTFLAPALWQLTSPFPPFSYWWRRPEETRQDNRAVKKLHSVPQEISRAGTHPIRILDLKEARIAIIPKLLSLDMSPEYRTELKLLEASHNSPITIAHMHMHMAQWAQWPHTPTSYRSQSQTAFLSPALLKPATKAVKTTKICI